MTVFKNRLYLAAYSGIFVLDDDDLIPVDMNLSHVLSTAYLDSNDGVMWSVGQKDTAYTSDRIIPVRAFREKCLDHLGELSSLHDVQVCL